MHSQRIGFAGLFDTRNIDSCGPGEKVFPVATGKRRSVLLQIASGICFAVLLQQCLSQIVLPGLGCFDNSTLKLRRVVLQRRIGRGMYDEMQASQGRFGEQRIEFHLATLKLSNQYFLHS